LTIKFAGQHSEHALILVDIQLVNYVNVKDLKAMHYELNPKHKLPWQAGRKGALCPKWSHDQALSLLKQSLPALKGNRRYATINGVAFCAQEHRPGVWHGYPIGWDAVPTKISKQWVKDGKVTRKQIRDSRNEARQGNDE
jgi:hypothetical protein